jgi:SAM-dependent methyltransferase
MRELLQRPEIIRAGQFAVTGEWKHRGMARMAQEILAGPHESVLDLGCGRSPLLQHLQPERYVGLDLHPPDLAYARRHHDRPGYEFLEADILKAPFERWQGIDVVTSASVFHHLTDEQIGELMEKIGTELRPGRLVFLDGVTIGPLGRLITKLDYGAPERPKAELFDLFRPAFEVKENWSYDNHFRTFHIFGFELTPVSG